MNSDKNDLYKKSDKPKKNRQNLVENLCKSLNYSFKNQQLIKIALTHKSYSHTNNERLEFLGDGVLDFVIAAELYKRFPKLQEGILSTMRSHLVRQESLFEIAQNLKLSDLILLSSGEKHNGGDQRPSILADSVEAIFGAIYLDGGFESVQKVILQIYQEKLNNLNNSQIQQNNRISQTDLKDSKTQLQEFLQAHKLGLPKYALLIESGTPQQPLFTISLQIKNVEIYQCTAISRRIAEQQIAEKLLQELNQKNADGSLNLKNLQKLKKKIRDGRNKSLKNLDVLLAERQNNNK